MAIDRLSNADSFPLGLIAGEGTFPKLVVAGAQRAGRRVAVVALRGSADPGLRELADRFCWRGVVQLGAWIRAFKRAGCHEVIMAGRVRKTEMFASPRWLQWLQYLPDLTSIRVWYFHARDKRNDTLLGAVADEMQRRGLTLVDSTKYCPEALAEEGVLTPGEPPPQVLADAEFAWPLAKQIAALDIGQSLAVKEREIIAVEAIEGTDKLIARAGELCPQGGWTLVKVAKPEQDMRFDVPTIGPTTIENLHRAKAAGLVVEAGKTLVLEREQTLALAVRYRVALLARASARG
ncbi:MAG: UDP-2,3-diacylglucosamine diphosphatase LpxI [Planctomycetes bacterium]|nr:UDP-2,3-diacylglucosamine diphosphatase LpxI [Planctomycetota bacterium]